MVEIGPKISLIRSAALLQERKHQPYPCSNDEINASPANLSVIVTAFAQVGQSNSALMGNPSLPQVFSLSNLISCRCIKVDELINDEHAKRRYVRVSKLFHSSLQAMLWIERVIRRGSVLLAGANPLIWTVLARLLSR